MSLKSLVAEQRSDVVVRSPFHNVSQIPGGNFWIPYSQRYMKVHIWDLEGYLLTLPYTRQEFSINVDALSSVLAFLPRTPNALLVHL